ncbi:hypothetical protein NL464_28090, partial [Klebsiella pneumoniae]|nr:hypothetical protein [Klebsiella pneumoniae]
TAALLRIAVESSTDILPNESFFFQAAWSGLLACAGLCCPGGLAGYFRPGFSEPIPLAASVDSCLG